MLLQLKKLNNESGIVLFIVLMTAIIIMIFSVGILTQSMNEMYYAQQQIDQISSEELAKGVFWNAYASTLYDNGYSYTEYAKNESGRNYVANIVLNSTTDGISSYNVVVNYDTF